MHGEETLDVLLNRCAATCARMELAIDIHANLVYVTESGSKVSAFVAVK